MSAQLGRITVLALIVTSASLELLILVMKNDGRSDYSTAFKVIKVVSNSL